MIGAIIDVLNKILLAINQVTNNYGLSIIILTILVRTLTWPLMKKQLTSAKAMQEMQPELKKIQEKYKKDPEKMNKATMELMKEYQVNPLMGCLPLLIQMPILWAMFRLLQSPPDLAEDTFFLFGTDMRLALNTIRGSLPILKQTGYWLLVILSGATTFFHQYLSITDKSQKSMLVFMPLVFLYFSTRVPAGLVLYWVTNNFLYIGQQLIVNKTPQKTAGEGSADDK